MHGGETIIDAHRRLAIREGLPYPCRMMIRLEFQPVGFSEGRVSQSKAWVFFHGEFQRRDGEIKIAGLVVALHVAQRFEVGLVGAGHHTAWGCQGRSRHFDFHQQGETRYRVILQSGEVSGEGIDPCGPDLAQVSGVNQVDGEKYGLIFLLDSSLDDHGSPQFPEGRRRIADLMTADHAGGHHPQGLLRGVEIGKLVGDRIHQAIGHQLILGIGGGTVEGQHRDVFLAAGVGGAEQIFPDARKRKGHQDGEQQAHGCEDNAAWLFLLFRCPARRGGAVDVFP